jgi:hypothetical protein
MKKMREENCINENMNTCEFKEIVFVDGFEVENGVLTLEQHIHLSSILRKV